MKQPGYYSQILRKKWNLLIERIGLEDRKNHVFNSLSELYTMSDRHYHNLSHLYRGLGELGNWLVQPEHVELAFFFHDVIYDPRRNDNEERSADFAKVSIKQMGGEDRLAEKINDMIIYTKHTEIPFDYESQLLLDIDLSILGKSESEFDEYENGIRKEYDFVSDEDFRNGRGEILEKFIKRPSIYITDRFRERYESKAIKNLERSIEKLRD